MHQYRHVLVRMRLGDSNRQIAKAGLMGRRKASAFRELAAHNGWLDPDSPVPDEAAIAQALGSSPARATPRAGSSLERYRDEITRWVELGIQGTTIHEALCRKHGYTGHYSSVRRFLQGIRKANPQATVMLEFAPGEAAQVDFGKGPTIPHPLTGEPQLTWVFVMTLAWSRHQYAEIVPDQKVSTWIACHRRAFEWFGGVPARIIIDNAKCAIVRACYHDPEVQRSYAELAEGYGFRIAPCPVRDPKKKGRVESGVKYIKRSFLPLREFRDRVDANRQLHEWIRSTAGNRLHGTTHERPLTRFVEVERHVLRPLPDVPPILGVWTRVKLHGNCHVTFEKAYYSAPFRLVRQHLWLRATPSTVELYLDHELVASHPRLARPGERSTVQDHLPPEAVAYQMQDPQWCLKKARALGPSTHELVERLFAHRVLDNLRAAQGVIRLAQRFGHERLEAACRRALRFDDPRYRTVKTILQKGLDQEPEPAEPSALAEAYTGKGRFCRDAAQLLLWDPPPAPQRRGPGETL
ncbi:IS21 family transposase [Deferrisoma camini]|uniref:IS21 family transposase n=1 Tax=Deferrisoma camini TaxID=1035120 RepID=UPI0004B1A134|nr:IS21 family transposase [Deferrisoma camini]